MAKLLREPLAPLITFALLLSTFFVVYLLERQDVSLLFQTLSSGCWTLLSIYWIIADSRKNQLSSCCDFGFLCVMFFPLSIPWHCFRSRGWRGAIMLVMLLAIWLFPYLVATMVWSALCGI